MTVIDIADARKSYRRRGRPPERALDGLDLSVGTGGVHGFGRERVRRHDHDAHATRVVGSVSALVETPLFFRARSAVASTCACWPARPGRRRRRSRSAWSRSACATGPTTASAATRSG